MKKFCATIFIFLIALLSKPIDTQACTCLPPPPPFEAFRDADVVLLAKVSSFEVVDSLSLRLAKLEIIEIWKGDWKQAKEIYTALHSAACGYDFLVGEAYLIYAYKLDDGRIHTHLCTRTAPMQYASGDLEFLKNLSYLPLSVGNRWSFAHEQQERIVDTLTVEDHLYFRFDRFREFRNPLIRFSQEGDLLVRSDSTEQVWLKFSAKVDDSWRVQEPSGLAKWTVHLQSTQDTVSVPAGEFTSCYRFYFQFDGSDNDWIEWYAPGVGVVKRDLLGFGYIEYPLESAFVNGRDISTAVEERESNEPIRTFELAQNYPNPFSLSKTSSSAQSTFIRYRLHRESVVSLKVHDLLGRLIRVLMDRSQPAGEHLAFWDGRDAEGNVVPSGIYFYHIQAGNVTQTKKMIVLP